MGSVVKSFVASKLGLSPAELYHVTVMPCYDKKLEGARDDFFDPTHNTRDVDCVLTTDELKSILSQVLATQDRDQKQASGAAATTTTTTAPSTAASAPSAAAATAAAEPDAVALFARVPESPLDL
jgi:iron only hydrogenase large subunit-like protein